MARIGIIGSQGRMGQAIAAFLAQSEHELAGGVDQGRVDQGEAIGELAAASDVLVDFSSPAALQGSLDAAKQAGTPLLIGTTGLSDAHDAAIDSASATVPILQTGNTSLGVTLLSALVEQAASRLGTDWDIEILEMHHRMKVDAPSGTALLLGDAAATGRGIELSGNSESGRHGQTGARKEGAIGFAALRGGSVAGDHSVIFAGEQERITISHSAENRMIFARGAVKAATWLIGKPNGRFTMRDVLDLT